MNEIYAKYNLDLLYNRYFELYTDLFPGLGYIIKKHVYYQYGITPSHAKLTVAKSVDYNGLYAKYKG